MPTIGPLELAIVAVILLIIFGPKRLPSVGRSIGEGVKGFRDTITGVNKEVDAEGLRAELEMPVVPEETKTPG